MESSDQTNELDDMYKWAEASGIRRLTTQDELSIDLEKLRASILAYCTKREVAAIEEFVVSLGLGTYGEYKYNIEWKDHRRNDAATGYHEACEDMEHWANKRIQALKQESK